jgi:LssY C-terminus
MKTGSIAVVLLLVTLSAAAATIPAGTPLQIRLATELNSSTAKAGDKFQALVIEPVVANGAIVMAAGVTLAGHVTQATSALKPDDQAALALAFDEIHDSHGVVAPIAAKLTSIDNARESVDKEGRIQGIVASKTGSGRLDEGINKISEKYPGFADLLGTVKQAVLKDTEANIDFKPGAEMTIELTKAVEWSGAAGAPNVSAIEPQEVLFQMVNRQPFRTETQQGARPSDVTNLMFLGTRQEIEDAFQKAGWSPAAKLDGASKLETFRALAEERGYQEAPVSVLLLNGQAPDLVFEKSNDTFNARHHLRVWRRPVGFGGQTVWVASATHDTGIDFSEKDRTFIHKIDSHIDRERAKVVNDLLLTGLVRGLSLVQRAGLPQDMLNATGDALMTDGAIAVLRF